jgi:AcrR family transcriptional regulator
VSSTTTTGAPDQRSRILDSALALMSEHGSADTSMRRLATACGLNVATLYHYFPSKVDLVTAVIQERGYFDLLSGEDAVSFDLALPMEQRLVEFLAFLSAAMLAEEAPVRLLLGEGLRRETTAVTTVTQLLAAIDEAIARWLADGFPDLPGPVDRHARTVRQLLVARLIEVLAGRPGSFADDTTWGREASQILLGS